MTLNISPIIHLISCEDIQRIKEELLVLVDELEELAMRGKTEAGNSVRIYVSHINFEATYSYLETSSLQLSMIRVYSINSITTQDSEMFNSLKDWIQSLKKFSTMISESGEMQRIQFFNRQREDYKYALEFELVSIKKQPRSSDCAIRNL